MGSTANDQDRPEPKPHIERLRRIFLVHAKIQTKIAARTSNGLGLLNSPRADPLVLMLGEDL